MSLLVSVKKLVALYLSDFIGNSSVGGGVKIVVALNALAKPCSEISFFYVCF